MFRFSLRELMLVTLVVGMGFAWWLDHRRLGEKAELADRFSQCTIHLAKMLERYGWHMTVHSSGALSGDYCDPAGPPADVSQLPDEDSVILWATDAQWRHTRRIRQLNRITTSR